MTIFWNNKTPNFNKLKYFGFKEFTDFYEISKDILNGEFYINIKVFKNGEIKTETRESFSGELYTLHLVEGAKGSFIGQIREEYEKFLSEISDTCFDMDLYSSDVTKQILKYVEEKYNNKPEFLWEKFPTYCIFRNSENKKWYAVIGTISKNKVDKNLKSADVVEIIDLRAPKEEVPELLKQDNIYPGWHMNKKSWITIILDGSMNIKNIQKYIDSSYSLAKK